MFQSSCFPLNILKNIIIAKFILNHSYINVTTELLSVVYFTARLQEYLAKQTLLINILRVKHAMVDKFADLMIVLRTIADLFTLHVYNHNYKQ